MIANIQYQGKAFNCDLSHPLSIGIDLRPNKNNVNAFFAPQPVSRPIVTDNFIGDTQKGGCVNFFDLHLYPHGNGTHIECVGHISKKRHYINEVLNRHFFICKLITLLPEKISNKDTVISLLQIEHLIKEENLEGLIIRTLPNDKLKMLAQYSGHNPCYLTEEAAQYLAQRNIKHLLIDLPSIDKEEDQGLLLAHHAFWQYPHQTRIDATITELIYVPNEIVDGLYLLNIQAIKIESDAVPINPVLYKLF